MNRFLFTIILLLPLILCSQVYENINKSDGLSHNHVSCIFRDHTGFMWFGTADGLDKYDGYKFTTYRPFADTSANNAITAIIEDQSGTMWIGTNKGLFKFDSETNKFSIIRQIDILQDACITCLYLDHRDSLWIGTSGKGLFNLNLENLGFFNFMNISDNKNSLSSNTITSVYKDKSGVIWIGTDNGINRYNSVKNNFVHYINKKHDAAMLNDKYVSVIYKDKSENLWIGTDNGLYFYDKNTKKIKTYYHDKNDLQYEYSLSNNFITSIYEDSKGVLWFGTDYGLNRFDAQTDQFHPYTYSISSPSSKFYNRVRSVYQDKSGIIWIATFGGITKIRTVKEYFSHHINEILTKKSITDYHIRAIYQQESGEIWIGCEYGLFKYMPEAKETIYYSRNKNDLKSLSNNQVQSIYQDTNDNIWIGTRNGLNKFDPDQNKFIRFQFDPDNEYTISNNDIRIIYQDKSGIIWIGTSCGLNRFNQNDTTFTRYIYDSNNLDKADNRVTALFSDKHKTLWIGTENGLIRYKNNIYRFNYDETDPYSISSDFITCVYEDSSGNLWIGTKNGLNQLNRRSERFTRYNIKLNYPGKYISGITEDRNGNLWICTKNGLYKMFAGSEQFRRFGEKDSLHIDCFHSCYKNINGEILCAGKNGYVTFFPDSLGSQNIPVVLTDFLIENKPVLPGKNSPLKRPIHNTNKIILNYNQNDLSFEFAALDYHNPAQNRYAYKLTPVEEDWAYCDASRRFVTYTKLKPGSYSFQLKGSNSYGEWSTEAASVKIRIRPPLWQTEGAYMFYVLLAGLMLTGLWRYQMKRIRIHNELRINKLQAEKLEEIDRLKSRFFANISHEFRTPLTLIKGPLEQMISGNYTGDSGKQHRVMLRNTNKMLNLINQLLDLSKLESGTMKLQCRQQNIIIFIKRILSTFISLAESKKITLKFNNSDDYIELYFDTEKIERVLNNLLSNAFKFTPEGGIISIQIENISENRDMANLSHTENKNNENLQSSAQSDQSSIKNDKTDKDQLKYFSGDYENDFIKISVTNTGPGIPYDQQPKIFNRFYQVDDSNYEGTGIGLALAKELVELHHGHISVESIPGLRTKFTILLPQGNKHLSPEEIITQHESDDEQSSPFDMDIKQKSASVIHSIENQFSTAPAINLHTPILLIVEDNDDLRQYIKSNMENFYKVCEAANGKEALDLAVEKIPDLIISDIMMPVMDGYELCRRLKSDQITSHIPVILLTAKAAKEDKIAGLETGADDYVPKPFDPDVLMARVKNLIDQRKNLRERFSKDSSLVMDGIARNSLDEEFVQNVHRIIAEHLSDTHFNLEYLASESGMSRMQLHRKIQGLFGQSPGEFIRTIRLKRGAEMLSKTEDNISEIAYKVGFENPANFATSFRQQFGLSPTQFRKSLTQN